MTRTTTTKAEPSTSKPTVRKSTAIRETGKPFTFDFEAPAGHISTGKTLVVYKGRGKGGVDIYLPLALIAQELGYLPEGAEISVTVTPRGKAISDPVCAVPKTMQNRFSKDEEHTFQDVYGVTFAEHLENLANPQEETRKAANNRTVKPQKADDVRRPGNRSEHREASSLSDRVDGLANAVEKLAKLMLEGQNGKARK